jgi:hypothetical protein
MKLHAIDKEKPTKKFVGRKRKTAKEKGEKHHPVSLRWFWNMLVAGEKDRRLCWKRALLLCLLQIGLVKIRRNSVESHLLVPFLDHLHSVRNLLDGHARVEHSGAARRKQEQGRRSSGGGRGIASW